jgi:MFS family permease
MLYTRPYIVMSFANLLTVSSFGSFFLFPLFISQHGGSKADIGILMGAMILASVLCRPWISELIDRIGRKSCYTIGSSIMSITPLIYLSFQGNLTDFYLPLLGTRLLHGAGLSFWFTGALTYVADIVPNARLNEGIGTFGISGLVGLALGPVIGEAAIHHFGYPGYFVVGAALAASGLLMHLPLTETYIRIGSAASTSFFGVLKQERSLTIVLLAALFGVGLAATGSFVSPYAEAKRLSFISLYFISYSAAAISTRLFGGRLGDRLGETQIIPYALVLTGAGLLTMIFLRGSLVLLISGITTGCGHGFLFPALNALAVRHAAREIKGKVTGVFTGGIDSGTFLGSILLGYIGEWAGFPCLFLVAGLALLGGLGIFAWRKNTISDTEPSHIEQTPATIPRDLSAFCRSGQD